MKGISRKWLCSVLVALLSPLTTQAFPIAMPGTEGESIYVAGSPIVATYQGNSAAFSNDLYLMLDAMGSPGDDGDLSNDLFIFNNHASAVGSEFDMGSFALGVELMFRLHVNDTGFDYFTGPASRNPDGKAHARVEEEWAPGVTLVSFEDLFDTPEGVDGYNDLSFSFSNTTATPANPIPEPQTLAILSLGLFGLSYNRRRR